MQVERYDGIMVQLQTGIRLFECGACGWCHPQDFNGDCRDRTARFYMPNDPDETNFIEHMACVLSTDHPPPRSEATNG